jgi:hypothetical protein
MPDSKSMDDMLIRLAGERPLPRFDPSGGHVHFCGNCLSEAESGFYAEAAEVLPDIQRSRITALHYYLKSKSDPRYAVVELPYSCPCGVELVGYGYFSFEEDRVPESALEVLLFDVRGALPFELAIDGIYKRSYCQLVLQKMLIRWRLTKRIVYLVVPFIGYFRQRAGARLGLLIDLLANLDDRRTVLVTRSASIGDIRKAVDEGSVPFIRLEEFGLISPIVTGAIRKQKFHAKYFAGIASEGVEALVGSHNIQGGDYLENLHARQYTFERFVERYLIETDAVAVPIDNESLELLVIRRSGPRGEFGGRQVILPNGYLSDVAALQ